MYTILNNPIFSMSIFFYTPASQKILYPIPLLSPGFAIGSKTSTSTTTRVSQFLKIWTMDGPGEEYSKRSGQIPAFGNWEYANDLPITQYFECARKAGLIRFTNDVGTTTTTTTNSHSSGECRDPRLHALHFNKPIPLPLKTKPGSNALWLPVMEQKQQVKKKKKKKKKVYELVKEAPRKQSLSQKQQQLQLPKGSTNIRDSRQQKPPTTNNVKRVVIRAAVDEDLYKIPPDLLNTSERKKRLGFFSRCLVSPCME